MQFGGWEEALESIGLGGKKHGWQDGIDDFGNKVDKGHVGRNAWD